MSPLRRAALRLGEHEVEVDLPPSIAWQQPRPNAPQVGRIEDEAIRRALAVPTAGASLREVVAGAAGAAVVIPDRTRAAGLSRVLPVLLDALLECVAGHVPITLTSGGGTHSPDDLEAVRALVPARHRERIVAGVHDARDERAHVPVGTTSRGTPVALDRRVVENAPAVVVVGAIGFHYFAGFAGGRKGIFPGLGALESIRRNHALVLSPEGPGLAEGCRPGNLEGNPVHADLLEAAGLVPGPVFLANALADARGEVVDVVTGSLDAAHEIGCERHRRSRTLTLQGRCDVLLADAGGHPRDIDLIQSHKSLVHAAPALEPGGALVLLARCPEGIGSRTFLPCFESGSSSARLERAIRREYRLNGHTALSFRTLTERFDVYMVTDLDPSLVEMLGATAVNGAGAALAAACAAHPRARFGTVLGNPTEVIIEMHERRR